MDRRALVPGAIGHRTDEYAFRLNSEPMKSTRLPRKHVPNITVFTAVVGSRDYLREDQNTKGARFTAFVDRAWESTVWREANAHNKFRSARRNAKIHKILSHQFVQSRYSLWMDANVSLRVPASQLIDEYLSDCDLATFQHRRRDCTYDEANICIAKNLDNAATILRQIAKYKAAGLKANMGLPEATIILRRHTETVASFNNVWWSELSCHSVRDQISFMYAAEATGLKYKFITPAKFENPRFDVIKRGAEAEPDHLR
jgi:alkaline ceramidase TOD1/glycosyltransferase MUCI70-like protein